MKLLDWMQHKFRPTTNENLTEFAPRNSCARLTGQLSFDELQYYPKPDYHAKAPNNTQKNKQFRKSFACIEPARADDEQIDESAAFSQLFHGFLAIGTLATETVTNEPATPTFATFVENIMGKETKETDNDEFEKVLEAEGNENGKVVCPLQDYLFGSVIGLAETETIKKERGTSLGELFEKSKMVEEITGDKSNKFEKKKEKENEKSAVHLMKRILKRRTICSSSRRSMSVSGGANDSVSAEKKPRKILQMFHKKVHPEGLPHAHKSENHSKYVTIDNFTEGYRNGNQMLSEDIILFPKSNMSKKGANCSKSYMLNYACCMGDSDGNRECWIKSDSEYLVLEL